MKREHTEVIEELPRHCRQGIRVDLQDVVEVVICPLKVAGGGFDAAQHVGGPRDDAIHAFTREEPIAFVPKVCAEPTRE